MNRALINRFLVLLDPVIVQIFQAALLKIQIWFFDGFSIGFSKDTGTVMILTDSKTK